MSDINEMNEGPRWYVAHTYSGYEQKVKTNLEKIVENRNLHDMIFDICIPTEKIVETDGSSEKEIESKTYPSYVFVKMVMTEDTWHVVRDIRGVTGFVGPGSRPVPLSDEEAASILGEEHTTVVSAINVGDEVDIVEGIFAGYSGRLTEISADGQEITVTISTVGRDMSVKLSMKHVRKKKNS